MEHSSFYLLIAGTYTPFLLITIGGVKGFIICSIFWSLAILGAIFQTLTKPGFVSLLAGGLCYSVGVLFFVFNWFKYHHFI